MWKVEKYKEFCAKNYPAKGKLMLSKLGNTSLDHIATYQAVFEYTHIHLILSDYLSTTSVKNLNKTSKSFDNFHTVLLHAEPSTICEMFQHDSDYTSQTTMHIEHRLQFFSS